MAAKALAPINGEFRDLGDAQARLLHLRTISCRRFRASRWAPRRPSLCDQEPQRCSSADRSIGIEFPRPCPTGRGRRSHAAGIGGASASMNSLQGSGVFALNCCKSTQGLSGRRGYRPVSAGCCSALPVSDELSFKPGRLRFNRSQLRSGPRQSHRSGKGSPSALRIF